MHSPPAGSFTGQKRNRHGQEDRYRGAETGGGHALSATVRRTLPAARAHSPWRCRGANAIRSEPDALATGPWSSQRHWHAKEDEFIYVLSGEVVLATDAGEELLRAGDCAGFKAGDPDGHCLQNRGTEAAMVLEIGSRIPGEYATYSDIDMKTEPGVGYVHKDGTPYPKTTRRGPD